MQKNRFLYLFVIQFLIISFLPSAGWTQRPVKFREVKNAIRGARGNAKIPMLNAGKIRPSVAPVRIPARGKKTVLPTEEIKHIDLEETRKQFAQLQEQQAHNEQNKIEVSSYITTTRRREAAKKARFYEGKDSPSPREANPIATAALSAPEQWRQESVVANFHWQTREDISAPEVTGDPYRRALDQGERPAPVKSFKRSMESLLIEGQTDGILPRNWQTLSRQELEDFIRTVRQMQEKIENIRFRMYWKKFAVQAELAGENMIKGSYDYEAEVWAQKQPDFFEDNFISSINSYDEPFNKQVNFLRILVVNDDIHLLARYVEAQNERVMVEGVSSVLEAVTKLQENPNAYNIIFTDYHLTDATARKLSSYVLTEGLNIPVIALANAEALPSWWYNIGMDGSLPHQEAEKIYNYASNIVATGRAFPNNN